MSALSFAKIGVLSGILALASTACVTPDDGSIEQENLGEVGQEIQAAKVELAAVNIIGNPLEEVGGIVPCVKVRRNLYINSLSTGKRGVEYDISYTSDGETIEETVMVPMWEGEFMGPAPDSNKYFLMDAPIELEQRADAGTPITVEVALVKNINNY